MTADRGTRFAGGSGSVLAEAAAARALSVVLRHQGRAVLADRVTLAAADRVDAAGLSTPGRIGAYAQLLCTCAYNAAHAGDRDRALDLVAGAERAAVGGMSAAQVALYRVGVHWSLGDAGAAVEVGRRLHPGQFATAERRGRLHTDLARAWWLRGDAEQAALALLAARREAPAEIRSRPSIRRLIDELARRRPRAAGVAELVRAGGARAG